MKRTKCTSCGNYVASSTYETGEEYHCDCQNTIQADFNPALWIFVEV